MNFSTKTSLDENVTISATLTQDFAGESGVLIQPNTATVLFIQGGSLLCHTEHQSPLVKVCNHAKQFPIPT